MVCVENYAEAEYIRNGIMSLIAVPGIVYRKPWKMQIFMLVIANEIENILQIQTKKYNCGSECAKYMKTKIHATHQQNALKAHMNACSEKKTM